MLFGGMFSPNAQNKSNRNRQNVDSKRERANGKKFNAFISHYQKNSQDQCIVLAIELRLLGIQLLITPQSFILLKKLN